MYFDTFSSVYYAVIQQAENKDSLLSERKTIEQSEAVARRCSVKKVF